MKSTSFTEPCNFGKLANAIFFGTDMQGWPLLFSRKSWRGLQPWHIGKIQHFLQSYQPTGTHVANMKFLNQRVMIIHDLGLPGTSYVHMQSYDLLYFPIIVMSQSSRKGRTTRQTFKQKASRHLTIFALNQITHRL